MVSGLTTKAMVLFPQPRGLPTPQPTTSRSTYRDGRRNLGQR